MGIGIISFPYMLFGLKGKFTESKLISIGALTNQKTNHFRTKGNSFDRRWVQKKESLESNVVSIEILALSSYFFRGQKKRK